MSACVLCKSNEINNLELGEMKVLGDLQVHYFCLLLSSGLLTNGEENEGILGFLPSDIKKESRRAIRLKCHYCHQTGASIGCCKSACNHSFHLNCGLRNKCLNQFTSEFKSFCHRHVVDSKVEKCSPDRVCIICYAEMGEYDKIQSVFAPCCKSEWFHKICLMKLADSAGYFFKCPKCNDVKTFSDECMKRGIFIPQRDASWETEENAFHELMERPNRCNAINCTCTDGRDSDKKSNELMICVTCGSNCMHKKCWQRNEPYYCCFPVVLKDVSGPGSTNRRNTVSKDDGISIEIRRKRKREYQTDDDEKLDERKRKRRKTDQFREKSSTRRRDTPSSKVNRRHNDDDEKLDERKRKRRKTVQFREKSSTRHKAIDNHNHKDVIDSNYPIKKIRNGTFDQISRLTPRVVLYPMSQEHINKLSGKSVHPVDLNKLLITSKFDNNNSTKEDLSNSSFTIISPTKKNGGKSFKNFTITSFFKVMPFK